MTNKTNTLAEDVKRVMEPPKFTKATCRGSYVFGTACGKCERCEYEREYKDNTLIRQLLWVIAEKDEIMKVWNTTPLGQLEERVKQSLASTKELTELVED